MRILVGTVDIAGQICTYADGFRKLGHEVTTAISEENPSYPDAQYDIKVSRDECRWSWKANYLVQVGWLLWLSARRGLISHDLFVFMWAGRSLLVFNSEYAILKKFRKRLVSIFNGDDVRHWSAYTQQMAPLISKGSSVALQDLGTAYKYDLLARPLRNLRIAELYSDLILSVPNQSALALRPYMHFFVPLNLSEYRSHIPNRDIPVIVHAPTETGVKGTAMIMSALDQLRAEGISFELRVLQGKSNTQVISELADADVAIDQLHLPLHGKFAVEAMASGCALATCNREEYEPFPPNRPIWHIGPENVYQQLRHLITDRELRVRLAYDALDYVKQYHDHVQVSRRILDALSAGASRRYDHYPTFFADSYQLPKGTVIPEHLKRMTTRIVQRWGLPEDVDPQDMIRRGLMSSHGFESFRPIPRWKVDSPSHQRLAI